MAKLITDHDPFHIHKTLGVLVLLHYIYRFYILIKTGTCFPPDEEPLHAALTVAAHGLLSWSSLLLPLPKKRNFKSPMIWPELRLHSIAFASRHVVSSIVTLLDVWPTKLLTRSVAKIALVLSTSKAASIITEKYGDRERRTTNAMPYPPATTEYQQKAVKKAYALAQFQATMYAMMDDASLNFIPLLGIQTAPLMMTLVRKGKCSSMWYHRIYAISLTLPAIVGVCRLISSDEIDEIALGAILASVAFSARIELRLSTNLIWSLAGLLEFYVYPLFFRNSLTKEVAQYFVYILGGLLLFDVFLILFGPYAQKVGMIESLKFYPFCSTAGQLLF